MNKKLTFKEYENNDSYILVTSKEQHNKLFKWFKENDFNAPSESDYCEQVINEGWYLKCRWGENSNLFPFKDSYNICNVENLEFKKPKYVKVNKDVTIRTLAKNHWCWCKNKTLKFLNENVDSDIYKVIREYGGCYDLESTTREDEDIYKLVNKDLFKEVDYE